MKDQLQSIIAVLELAQNNLAPCRPPAGDADRELWDTYGTAVTEARRLEAILGEQEPVAKLHDDGHWTPMKTEAGRALNDRMMRAGSPSIDVYAAPVTQQPQAEKRCEYCDGTGDVHGLYGEWRGECHCCKRPQAEAAAWRARDANGRWMYGDLPAPDLPAGEPELLALVAPQQAEAAPSDVVTHRNAWRNALTIAKSRSKTLDDADYWEHEIQAFERVFDVLAKLAAPQQVEAVRWGIDWGERGDRACVSIVKKHTDGTIEVVASECEPERIAALRRAKAAPQLQVVEPRPVEWKIKSIKWPDGFWLTPPSITSNNELELILLAQKVGGQIEYEEPING